MGTGSVSTEGRLRARAAVWVGMLAPHFPAWDSLLLTPVLTTCEIPVWVSVCMSVWPSVSKFEKLETQILFLGLNLFTRHGFVDLCHSLN